MPETERFGMSMPLLAVCVGQIGGWGAVRKIGRGGEGGDRQTDSVEDKGAF